MNKGGLQLYFLPLSGLLLIQLCLVTTIICLPLPAWSDDPLIHNSNRFGSCSDPAYDGTSQAECEGVGGTWSPTAKWSGTWGTVEAGSGYGEFVCETCHEFRALNIKGVKSVITAPNSTVNDFPGGSVVFLSNKDGVSDFGDDTACSDPAYVTQTDCETNGETWMPRTTSDKICEVCHSETQYHRYDTTGQTVFNHKNSSDCTLCHAHNKGFSPLDCESCHGVPPTDNSSGGPTGLVNSEGGTGSVTSGAHTRHATDAELGYPCGTCHANGMPATDIYDKNIQIGFKVLNTYIGGTYDGRVLPLANGYGYEAGNLQTTVTNTGLMECYGIYCHGATMDPNGGTDVTPVWDDPATAQCGTCHGASASSYPTRGGHMKHVRAFLIGYNYECNLCHKDPASDDSLHVNNRSEVVFSTDPRTAGGTYSGTVTMLDTYGTCTNVYCHSTVQSSPPGGGPIYKTTYAWGEPISLGCGSCHGYFDGLSPSTLISGSHEKHFEYKWGFSADCFPCHNYNNAPNAHGACHAGGGFGDPQRDRHADHTIDVALSPPYGGSYSGSLTPGVGYGDCSNTYCHSDGTSVSSGVVPDNTTVVWGTAGPLACDACHGYPPAYATGSPKANRHTLSEHSAFGCQYCHNTTSNDGVSIASTDAHVNKTYDVVPGGGESFTYTFSLSGGTCDSVSCHGGGSETW